METLRKAEPDERRYIARQALDYYRTLVIGGVYTFDSRTNGTDIDTALTQALKNCVSVHPLLSAVILDEGTEAPKWARPQVLNLNNHLQILKSQDDVNKDNERDIIKRIVTETNDHIFPCRDEIPPWKIVVYPLSNNETTKRYLILFAYYHSHGDGKSGLNFHKSLLSGLHLSQETSCPFSPAKECDTPDTPLLPSIFTSGKLTISWSFLLKPVLGAYLPSFIKTLFGLRASASPESEDQWKGLTTFYDAQNHHTGLEFITIKSAQLSRILQTCRAHGTKFTGLLDQLILHSLSFTLPPEKAGSFLSQIVVDLRKHFPEIPEEGLACCPSAHYNLNIRPSSPLQKDWVTASSSDAIWTTAKSTTEKLVACAGTTHDQPIGLLAYLKEIYPWMKEQIGKNRDCSYEISNLGSFKPAAARGSDGEGEAWDIEGMVFSQPANATSAALTFNVVAREGGDLWIGVNWQKGAIGVDEEEEAFVRKVCERLGSDLRDLGGE